MKNLNSKNARAQRKLIAEDVLRQMAAGKLSARHGEYVTWVDVHDGEDLVFEEGKNLKDALEPLQSCEVCAKGAAFMAIVDRFDKVSLTPDFWEYYDIQECDKSLPTNVIHESLFEYFGKVQIFLVESAFEGWSILDQKDRIKKLNIMVKGVHEDDAQYDFSCIPKDEYKADMRLAMIMRNIIKHDGDFNPQAFIDEMNETGYDMDVLNPWIEAAKREREEDKKSQ